MWTKTSGARQNTGHALLLWNRYLLLGPWSVPSMCMFDHLWPLSAGATHRLDCQHWLTWEVVRPCLCSSPLSHFSTSQLALLCPQFGHHHRVLPIVAEILGRLTWVCLTLCLPAPCSLLGRSRAATDACCAQPALLSRSSLCYSSARTARVACTLVLCTCIAVCYSVTAVHCCPTRCVTVVQCTRRLCCAQQVLRAHRSCCAHNDCFKCIAVCCPLYCARLAQIVHWL